MNIKLIDSLLQIINSLTPEERINLEDEPFVGMWKDRQDIEDSSQWVQQVRQQELMS